MIEVLLYLEQKGYEEGATGAPTASETRYLVSGANSQREAVRAVKNMLPTNTNGMVLDRASIESDHGSGRYTVAVRYRMSQNPLVASSTATGGGGGAKPFVSTSYSVGGGMETRTRAFATKWSSPEAPTDPYNLVNVDIEGKVNGVPVPVSETTFSETHRFSQSDMTDSYVRTLMEMRGKVNNAKFRQWEAGECKLEGVSMSNRQDASGRWWELTFNFKISVNASVTLGGEWTTLKRGWDVGWVCYRQQYDPVGKVMMSAPAYARIQQVLEYDNFSKLKIG